MLKTAINPFIKFTANPTRLIKTPLYLNSSTSPASTLKKVLDSEIKIEQQQKKSIDNFNHFFNAQGWDVKFNDVEVIISKKLDNYNLKMVAYAKPPPAQIQEEQQKQNEQQDLSDYQQINLFINKEGAPGSMCIMMVQQQGQSQLASIYFVDSQEKQTVSLVQSNLSTASYHGPDIQSLDAELQKHLAQFIGKFGITPQLLQRIGQLSSDYEHSLYLEWLKDMRSIV